MKRLDRRRGEHGGAEEVEEGPELDEVVLEGRAGEDDPRLGADAMERGGDLRVVVLDLVAALGIS